MRFCSAIPAQHCYRPVLGSALILNWAPIRCQTGYIWIYPNRGQNLKDLSLAPTWKSGAQITTQYWGPWQWKWQCSKFTSSLTSFLLMPCFVWGIFKPRQEKKVWCENVLKSAYFDRFLFTKLQFRPVIFLGDFPHLWFFWKTTTIS